MKTQWIVENFVKEPSFKELSEAIKKLDYPFIPIEGDYRRDMLAGLTSKCVVVNGSIKMVKLMKQDLPPDCFPVSYCTFENYRCTAYYSHFGPYLFNDQYAIMSLKEVVRQKYSVWGHYGKDAMIFIRPDSGEKTFQAGLLDIIDLPTLYDSNQDVEHDLVLVSTPKTILWEGRFVVSKFKEIIASSTYRFQGKVCLIPSVPVEATKFCQEVLNKVDYHPDSVFCLDVCQDSDKNCWVLELTSFSSAGLYACNKEHIVQKVSEIAEKEYSLRSP